MNVSFSSRVRPRRTLRTADDRLSYLSLGKTPAKMREAVGVALQKRLLRLLTATARGTPPPLWHARI